MKVEKNKNHKNKAAKRLLGDKSKKKLRAKTKIASEQTNILIGCKDISELVLEHREKGRKLARSILKRWNVSLPGEEIDSIVDLSLCEAAKRYDQSKGASFITFLFYHMRGFFVRSITSSAQENSIFVACAQSVGIDTTDWYRIENGPTWDYVPEYLTEEFQSIENPEDILLREEKIANCREALAKLDHLEQVVIMKAYFNEESLVDVARELGYSRCHVSRIKRSALSKLEGLINKNLLTLGSELEHGRSFISKIGMLEETRVSRKKKRNSNKIRSNRTVLKSQISEAA